MRILVLSDSHGDTAAVYRAIDAQPMAKDILFLGDGFSDITQAVTRYPDRRFHMVRGNCDFGCAEAPVSQVVTLGGKRLYLTHGYAEHVKSQLLTLYLTAQENDAQVALFGHTHTPLTQYDGGIWLVNPGSVSGYQPTYGTLDIEQGGILPNIVPLRR